MGVVGTFHMNVQVAGKKYGIGEDSVTKTSRARDSSSKKSEVTTPVLYILSTIKEEETSVSFTESASNDVMSAISGREE